MTGAAGPEYVSIKQVAARLGCTRQSVRELLIGRDGRPPSLPYLKVGARCIRIKAADVDRFIADNTVTPAGR